MSNTDTIMIRTDAVVEQFVKDTYFVPNDTINTTDNRIMLITGPNKPENRHLATDR